jgi:hypothetical protein
MPVYLSVAGLMVEIAAEVTETAIINEIRITGTNHIWLVFRLYISFICHTKLI